MTPREIHELTGLPWDSGGIHYPERLSEITTANGSWIRQVDEEPQYSGTPFGAKRLDVIWIDQESWVRVDPWPPWCGERPFFLRLAGLQGFVP